ncbi:CBS domain-containing protein [Streptomyces sp. NBC_00234]|uniref:CBS domain-containing protein n=1 Tax=Streptomyces sp. NBC_00234 TaxID=2903638 RepID=UPI002E2DE6EF|nr:CBS domain-containing protein [Streptomyces sp. NBC_00234]
MKQTEVGRLMTDEVVSAVPSTSFRNVAKLLAAHDISGVPVLDEEDRVLGVVSESDLLARRALTAGDLMTTPAVTVHAEQTVADAARLMVRLGVERLPVVDEEERLIGIVTRRDLLYVFLRSDAEIRRRVREDVLMDTMDLPGDAVGVHVLDGVVTLRGRLPRQSQVPMVLKFTEQVDGVVAVVDRLSARVDDSYPAPPARTARDDKPW